MAISIRDLDDLKARIDALCRTHNVIFYGVFSNTDTDTEVALVSNNSSSGILVTQGEATGLIPGSANESITGDSSGTSFGSAGSAGKANSSAEDSPNNISANAATKLCVYKTFTLALHSPTAVNNYLYNCFDEFQQIPCKLLAKAWIKIIEPKKQSTYPYKGGNSSKPYWWPADCRHKEPDHLKKEERIALLLSLLRVFKNREAELLNAAATINELAPHNRSNNTGHQYGSRKRAILHDMFRVVKNSTEENRETMVVIKPGRKYSSQLYQRIHERGVTVDAQKTREELKIAHLLVQPLGPGGSNEGVTATANILKDKGSNNENEITPVAFTSTPTKPHPQPHTSPSLHQVANAKAQSPLSSFSFPFEMSSPYRTPTRGDSRDPREIIRRNVDPRHLFHALDFEQRDRPCKGNSPNPLTVLSPSQLNIPSTPLGKPYRPGLNLTTDNTLDDVQEDTGV